MNKIKAEKAKNKNFRAGTIGIIFTVLVIVCAILLNVVFGILQTKFPMRLDLTKNQIFEITQQTRDYLKTIDSDVNIYVLSDESAFVNNSDYFYQANEVIKSYGRLSDKINVSYIDTVKNPAFTSKYPDLKLAEYDILVDGPYSDMVVSANDLFNVDYSYTYYGTQSAKISSSKAEQTMTSAIMNVTTKDKSTVMFLSGHDEPELSSLQELYSKNNYAVTSGSIAAGEIDPAVDMMVIIAPTRDFTDEELSKLDAFLDNDGKLGKNIIYLAHMSQPELPKLNAFLEEWGVLVEEKGIYETDSTKVYSSTSPFVITADYAEEDYSANFLSGMIPFVSPNSVKFTRAFDNKGTMTAIDLLSFSATSKAVLKTAEEMGSSDDKGPFSAAILCEKIGVSDNKSVYSRVVSFSSAESFVDSVVSSTTFSNGEYLLSLSNKINENDNAITIVPKQIEYSELNISYAGAVVMAVIFAIIIPIAILVAGIVIWVRRRHR